MWPGGHVCVIMQPAIIWPRNSLPCGSVLALANPMQRNGVIKGTAYDLRAVTYDFFFPDRSWEIVGWTRLARRYGRNVVEWMCGTGELACGLARRDFTVIGVDLVSEMLEVAEQRAAALPPDQRPKWVQDDIRDAALPRRDNDLAIIPARSFGHMLTREDQMDALRTVRRHLRPGGALAMALGVASKASRPEQTGIYGPMRPTPPNLSVRKVVRNQYDADSQLLTVHDQVEVRQGESQRVFEYTFSLRFFTPDQIVRLLTQAGYVAVGMFGDFDLTPWHQAASEWIVTAERPLN
jgi:ubiquinone/menaquinone biosynthesis C-methylase UbiE